MKYRLVLLSIQSLLCFSSEAKAVCQTDSEGDTTCVNVDLSDNPKWDNFVAELMEDLVTFDESQEILPLKGGSGYGVFAKEAIEEGTEIAVLRYSDMIGPLDNSYTLVCSTVESFVDEMTSEESYHKDYIQYVVQESKSHVLPIEAWSNETQFLLKKVIGFNLPPTEVSETVLGNDSWHEECDTYIELPSDVVSGLTFAQIVAVVVQRCLDDGMMVPFLDLYNHRSGDWANIRFIFDDDKEHLIVVSTRDIVAGEQLHYSRAEVRASNDPHFSENPIMETPQILRDYGVVEPYPQTFTLGSTIEIMVEESENEIKLSPESEGQDMSYREVSFLEEELFRLKQASGLLKTLPLHANYSVVSDNELIVIKQYHQSLIKAIELALGSYTLQASPSPEDDVYVRDQDEGVWANYLVCGSQSKSYMNFDGFYIDHESLLKSKYQQVSFYEYPEMHDKCLELETTVQICANYRPYYHEPFVHFTSVLLPSPPKRVVFVGGGDSMLLHEVLKYPSIEKVVGLELDQVVVRHSFKHFNTQPHFDDTRVEWWFGDATKTLNVLPKDYFGSFDLVLIDLSETVMSFTVTKSLNVIQALALLAKPDGIVVKNEHYFEEFQKIFDHTIELQHRANPVICDQRFAMGSNRIDFMKPKFEHLEGVETLLYHPVQNKTDHFDLIKHYSRNDAIAEKKCGKIGDDDDDDDDKQVKAGILMIVDAERAGAASTSLESLTDVLETAIKKEDLTILSTLIQPTDSGAVIVIITKEAFISLRTWSEHNYCAFDLHFWGAFDKQETLRNSLQEAVGSTQLSSYRIVVGGMVGTSTWDTDKKKIGPVITNTRKCDVNPTSDLADIKLNVDLVLKESLTLMDEIEGTTLIICGAEDKCAMLELLEKSPPTASTVAIFTCPVSGSLDLSKGIIEKVSLCNSSLQSAIKDIVNTNGTPISSVFIDSKVDDAQIQNLNEFVGRKSNQREFFADSALFVLPQISDSRISLMLALRVQALSFQSTAAEVQIGGVSSDVKIGFAFYGNSELLLKLSNICDNIEARTSVPTEINSLDGMVTKPLLNFEPHNYVHEDYDNKPGLDQYSRQLPLGSQSIFQLQYFDKQSSISTLKLKDAVGFALRMKFGSIQELKVIEEVSEGALIVALFSEGHLIMSWGGADRVDINVFTYDEDIKHEEMIVKNIMKVIQGFSIILLDEQPRGIERVVNFSKDIDSRTPGCWDTYDMCRVFASKGDCDGGDRKKWMNQYCAKSCNVCSSS